MFLEDIGAHGYVPWRSSDKILDGEACRQYVSRGDWKYSRSSSRDNSKGCYSIRDWRGHSWETSNGSSNTPGRPHDVNNEQRSLDDMLTYPSRSNSDFVNLWNRHKKDQHDNRTSGVNGMSSWGSGFSNSSSSKSVGSADSGEAKLELQQKTLAPVESPSGDVAACVTSAPPFDDTSSRKKPRLGWDKSPRVLGFSDCSSPATPSSVTCSSSPASESCLKQDTNPSPCMEEKSSESARRPSFNLENLDINSIINMVSSLIDLLQPDDPSTMDSNFLRSTAINKLLLWKGDILKTLEMTESEIDYLENKLKSLKVNSRSRNRLPSTASSLPVQVNGKSCEKQEAASSMISQPAPLKMDPSADVLEEKQHLCNGVLEDVSVDKKDGVSPGTATSDFMASSSLDKTVPLGDIVKVHDCSGNAGFAQLGTMEEMTLATDSFNEEGAAVIPGEGSVLVKIDTDAHASESSNSDTAGNLILEPSAEMINFASKLLLDPHVKHPFAVEKERALINPWTLEEKEIFMDKLAAFGKDFRKIATFLDHKTTADCVEFYYKNHKSKCFEKTKKKLDSTSVIAAQADSGMQKNQTSSSRIFLGERYSRTSRVDSIADRSSNFDLIGNNRETAAADVLAGICGSLPSEAMSSCITSSADPGESYHRYWKCPKVYSLLKRHSIPDFSQNVDEGTCSDESCGDMDPTDWTDEEKSVFIQAVSSYDASVLERPVVCSDKLGSKLEDFPSNFVRMNMDECDPISKPVLKTELNLPDENNGNHVAGQAISECGTDDMDVDSNAKSLKVQKSVASGDLNSGRNQVVEQGVSVAVSASIGVAAHHCTPIDVAEFRPATERRLAVSICRRDSNKTSDESAGQNSSSGFSFNTEGHLPNLDSAVEPSFDPKGYPLQISTLKEINSDAKSLSTSKRGVAGPYLAEYCYLQKCNSSKSTAELPHLVQNLEQAKDRPKSQTSNISGIGKPCGNGNVKLFGQMLNSNSQHLKQNTKPSNFKSTGNNVDGNSKFNQSNNRVPEAVAKRSYGFWNGSRIQTGLSPLPDYAILMAKYPSAFVNYPTSSSQMEQQALQTVVHNTDRTSNGRDCTKVNLFDP
ncbi:Serine carboxypeptidase-like 27 isoform 1 [Hibiscus syriacus]|uniref:Serine carboxypeptidase-like 27 isoform 1 n=1 Tax=Hibiscus syriacus TaxID=106335 RepID=A0A6A3ADH1_HIBSY|nr:Serine carboxypeptidase-like 27 isoform 1 [Hibiscus syriacus]